MKKRTKTESKNVLVLPAGVEPTEEIRKIILGEGAGTEEAVAEDDRLTVVEFDGEHLAESVSGAAERLVQIGRECRQKRREMKLYLLFDMLAGVDRENATESLLALVKSGGVRPNHVYRMCSGAADGQEPTIVQCEEISLTMQNFFSDMDAFFRYGRSQEFVYLLKSDAQGQAKTAEVQEVLNAVSRISEDLTLCRMENLESAFENLRKSLEKLTAGEKVATTGGYVRLFEQRIRIEYGNLLSEHTNLYDELVWLYGKKLYQQCMALAEWKTAEWFCEHYFCYKSEEEILENVTVAQKGSAEKVCLKNSVIRAEREETAAFRALKMLPNSPKHIRIKDGELKYIGGFVKGGQWLQCQVAVPIVSEKAEGKEGAVARFLACWKRMKEMRNAVIHVQKGGKNISVQNVSGLIQSFINAFRAVN